MLLVIISAAVSRWPSTKNETKLAFGVQLVAERENRIEHQKQNQTAAAAALGPFTYYVNIQT